MLVYLDHEDQNDGKAKGELFWDDGVSIGEHVILFQSHYIITYRPICL